MRRMESYTGSPWQGRPVLFSAGASRCRLARLRDSVRNPSVYFIAHPTNGARAQAYGCWKLATGDAKVNRASRQPCSRFDLLTSKNDECIADLFGHVSLLVSAPRRCGTMDQKVLRLWWWRKPEGVVLDVVTGVQPLREAAPVFSPEIKGV